MSFQKKQQYLILRYKELISVCGLAGFYAISPSSREKRENFQIISRMIATLQHRGPDFGSIWGDKEAGIYFGHRRLSIIDTSPLGHQPMHSHSARFVLVFNGEIYNHQEIRKELEKTASLPFRGRSDTEVFLTSIEEWGLEKALKSAVGMFAFALWDRKNRVLSLARDRVGEKPLYYGLINGFFLFGSELKALQAHPVFKPEVNREAVSLQMFCGYIPAPFSIYQKVFKLLPGNFLSISEHDHCITQKPTPYWSALEVATSGLQQPFSGSIGEAVEHLEFLLREAVKLQMVSDVPLGVFLSSGIDSSTIAALMQTQTTVPIKTFTIGFNESDCNEAPAAQAIAKYLRTEHTELYVGSNDAMAVIPKLATLFDEPFSDSSQIPTFLLACLAKRQVTVCLSGDGGDELFAGYNRYLWAPDILKNIQMFPFLLRKFFKLCLNLLSSGFFWGLIDKMIPLFLPARFMQQNLRDKFQKFVEIIDSEDSKALFISLISHWKHINPIFFDKPEDEIVKTDFLKFPDFQLFANDMMYLDLTSYLPNDLLVKIDRACMDTSLEPRMPFLDHRIIEFAWKIPLSLKIKAGKSKWILRQVLKKYIPQALFPRPKKGFRVPIDIWLRGPLRDWAEALLDYRRLKEEGFFKPRIIRQKWHGHLSGHRQCQDFLWNVLQFQAWLEETKRV